MAKISKSVSFKNAEINFEDGTITETTKDEIKVYSIEKLLTEWSRIEGLSVTIKQDNEMPTDEE